MSNWRPMLRSLVSMGRSVLGISGGQCAPIVKRNLHGGGCPGTLIDSLASGWTGHFPFQFSGVIGCGEG